MQQKVKYNVVKFKVGLLKTKNPHDVIILNLRKR